LTGQAIAALPAEQTLPGNMDAATTRLVRDMGPEVLACLGGAPSSALEQMKAKLQKRPPRKSQLAVFAALDATSAPRIRAEIAGGRTVAVRCKRAAAETRWPELAALCAQRVEDDDTPNDHVSKGSFVALNGDACYCIGGFRRQRDARNAASALVQEARRRSDRSERDFFVARASATFGDAERTQRLDHLFANVPERHLLQIDEEGAYGASNEICAAKFARTAADVGGVTCVVDATACVGGNAIAFARRFPRVVAIEVNEARSRMLAHNVTHMRRFEKLGRVDVVHGDCIEALPALAINWSHTLVFADPPWGGHHYEDCEDVDAEQGVHLKGKGTIDGFVDVVASLGCRRLLLKVPHTFDTTRFASHAAVMHCDARAVADKVQCVSLELRQRAVPVASPAKRARPEASPAKRAEASPAKRAPPEASSSKRKKKRRKKKHAPKEES